MNNRMVFPTNTNNIKDYHDRIRYIYEKFGSDSFTANELQEKYKLDPVFSIKSNTLANTLVCMTSLGLFKRDVKNYKITNYGKEFARSSLEEDIEFANKFLLKINEEYTCNVRDNIIHPYIYLIKTFQDLKGTVYKYELFPLFFIGSPEEYDTYIEIIKRAREENNKQIIVNFVQSLLNDNKITLNDIRVVVTRDTNYPIHLLKTLGFAKTKVAFNGDMLRLPGGYEISTETYYKFSEDGFDEYFSEEETVAIYADEMGDIDENVDETTLSINCPTPKEKVSTHSNKIQRSKKVQAYVLKRDKYSDFFKDVESEYGHYTPKTLKGKPKVIVHHTIPVKHQKHFKDKNLDVTYLCVCVCLICHDILHDESNGELELKTKLVQYMYEQKKDILATYLGITTYSDFAKYYNL